MFHGRESRWVGSTGSGRGWKGEWPGGQPQGHEPSIQYESDETTSPPLRVPSALQVVTLIESLTNATWPSQKSAFTPPGWLLRAALIAGLCGGLDCQQS